MNKSQRKGNYNKFKKQNGKTSRPKEKGGRIEEDLPEVTKHRYNDVSWYTKNQQMLVDAASYSFNNPLGNPIPWETMYALADAGDKFNWAAMVPTNGRRAIPGLYTLSFVPTIGKSVDSASPANIAAQNIYSYVRYMNSGAKNYDQADLMLYLLAMDSAYMAWNWLKRIYGYMRTYSQYNRYMPKVYAAADHINFDDFLGNLADLRLYINQLGAKLSAFCVPAVMPLFLRHSWLCSNIYKDSDLLKAQQYYFTPHAVYKYSETSSTYGGELIPVVLDSEVHSFYEIRSIINGLIDAISYSEDIGVMSGDILKAYGQDKLFKLVSLEPDYVVEPVYNEEVLNQIHNSTCLKPFNFTTGWKITQDPNSGYLIFNPQGSPIEIYTEKHMLNMPWDSVTPANVMVGTRLVTMLDIPSGTVTNPVISSCGSEIIVQNSILSMYSDGSIVFRDVSDRNIIVSNTAAGGNAFWNLIDVNYFDWHPLYTAWVDMGTTTAQQQFLCYGILGDVSNYTLVDSEDMSKLHYTAIMSEFNVPQIGSF